MAMTVKYVVVTDRQNWGVGEDLMSKKPDEWEPDSHWDDHPDWPVEDWQNEVATDDTSQSYVQWVNSQEEYKELEDDE